MLKSIILQGAFWMLQVFLIPLRKKVEKMENILTDKEIEKVYSAIDKFVEEYDGERMEVLVTHVEVLSHLVFRYMASGGYDKEGLKKAVDSIATSTKTEIDSCTGENTKTNAQ